MTIHFVCACLFSQNNTPASPSIVTGDFLWWTWEPNDCAAVKIYGIAAVISIVFTKLFLENALAIRPCNCEAASEPLLPKVAHCIPRPHENSVIDLWEESYFWRGRSRRFIIYSFLVHLMPGSLFQDQYPSSRKPSVVLELIPQPYIRLWSI